jgi:hypothetical protein
MKPSKADLWYSRKLDRLAVFYYGEKYITMVGRKGRVRYRRGGRTLLAIMDFFDFVGEV